MSELPKIDRATFEKLCGLQLEVEDICSWFGASTAELAAWCEAEYGKSLPDVVSRHAAKAKVALRSSQIAQARKSSGMAAYLDRTAKIGGSTPTKSVDYRKRKVYRELRAAMLANLAARDLNDDVYRDKVDEYLDFWVRRQELRDDIVRRGLTVVDERGRLSENRSVSLEIQVSRQMLAIFSTLGFKEDALAAAGRSDDDDEL